MPAAVAGLMLNVMANSTRRWMQFSLRTGFVIVTLLCVALSLWVVPAERQRRAVAAIEKLGGEVRYNESATRAYSVTFLRRWLPPDYFDEVIQVFFINTQVTDVGLVHVQGLAGLRELYLDGTQVSDAGLAYLQGLTNLQRLSLNDTQVTDAGLARLQRLTDLYALWLDNTAVTDAGLAHFRGLSGLAWLYLNDTQVTDAGVTRLQQALPNCRITGP